MPRRTHPPRRRGARLLVLPDPERSTEDIARELVANGTCSPQILSHPHQWRPKQGDN